MALQSGTLDLILVALLTSSCGLPILLRWTKRRMKSGLQTKATSVQVSALLQFLPVVFQTMISSGVEFENVLIAGKKLKPGQSDLSPQAKAFNAIHSWYRATVEHAIGKLFYTSTFL